MYGTFVRSAERQERCSRFVRWSRAPRNEVQYVNLDPPRIKRVSPLLEEVVPDAPLLAAVVAEELHAREVKGAPPAEQELRPI